MTPSTSWATVPSVPTLYSAAHGRFSPVAVFWPVEEQPVSSDRCCPVWSYSVNTSPRLVAGLVFQHHFPLQLHPHGPEQSGRDGWGGGVWIFMWTVLADKTKEGGSVRDSDGDSDTTRCEKCEKERGCHTVRKNNCWFVQLWDEWILNVSVPDFKLSLCDVCLTPWFLVYCTYALLWPPVPVSLSFYSVLR